MAEISNRLLYLGRYLAELNADGIKFTNPLRLFQIITEDINKLSERILKGDKKPS